MPYGGERNAAEVAKMERCVSRLKGKHGHVSAIRICKSSILHKGVKKNG